MSSLWQSTDVPNLLKNRDSGRYYARITIPGRGRTSRALGTTDLEAAKVKLAKLNLEVVKVRATKAKASEARNVIPELRTMGQLATILLDQIECSKLAKDTKENWHKNVARLRGYWPTEFDRTRPSQVNFQFILLFRKNMQTKPQRKGYRAKVAKIGYSNGVINATLEVLKALLDLAKRENLIFGETPFTEAEQSKRFADKIWLPKNSKRPVLPANFDMERMFHAMRTVANPEKYEPYQLARMQTQALDSAELARFLAFSGARRNEAAKMEWEQVSEKYILINGTKSKKAVRHVPIIVEMAELLTEMRARRVELGLPCRGRMFRVKNCRQAIHRACEQVGIVKLSNHDMRHYFITSSIEGGTPIPTLAKWVGHADGGALLMRTYTHVRDKHSEEFGNALSFGFGSKTPTVAPSASRYFSA